MPPKRYYRKTTSAPTTTKPASANGKSKFSGETTEGRLVRKWLLIVESPSKCKKIEEYLGPEYQCIASQGHIRTLDGLKSIDTKRDFTPTFTPVEEKTAHIKTMATIIAHYPKDHVLIATDDDREGEAIGWHLCVVFELPVDTTKRILFHEITKDAIRRAVDAPTTLNLSLIHAQHARQVLDMVVGYTVSPLLWKHVCNDKTNGLSAGRCQTPALRLIYDHHQSAKPRKIGTQYKTTGVFFERSIRFDLAHKHETESDVVAFLEKSKTFDHRLSMLSPKDTFKSPPKPFTTSRLLQTASSVLRYSPKTTMTLCQVLYQMGLITYMRTDSAKYSPVFLNQVETYILREWTDPRYVGDRATLENTESGNPHEAIRATNLHQSFLVDDNKSLVAMYRFIWKNTVESCMSTATYKTRAVCIRAPDDLFYEHTLEIPVFMGWKRVSCRTNGDAGDESTGVDVAQHQTGLQMYFEAFVDKPATVQYIESTVTATDSNANHYTEASLIHALEERGIGRPSTYATIVETIQERGYVKTRDITGTAVACSEYKLIKASATLEKTEKERVFGKEKDKLVMQPTGILVIEFLLQYFESLFSYDYTQTMETRLDEVAHSDPAQSDVAWREICRECYVRIKTLKKPLSAVKRETYVIESGVELVFHTNGASLKYTLEDGRIEYKAVKKNVDVDLGKLKRGEYSVDDLVEIPEELLGVWEEHEVLLKSGKYGAYVVWGDIKASVKHLDKPVNSIRLGDVIPLLEMKRREKDRTELGLDTLDISAIPDTYRGSSSEPPANRIMMTGTPDNPIRVLTREMSVRKGKYGSYIYYQKEGTKKPAFFNIQKFPDDCWKCPSESLMAWLTLTYHL